MALCIQAPAVPSCASRTRRGGGERGGVGVPPGRTTAVEDVVAVFLVALAPEQSERCTSLRLIGLVGENDVLPLRDSCCHLAYAILPMSTSGASVKYTRRPNICHLAIWRNASNIIALNVSGVN